MTPEATRPGRLDLRRTLAPFARRWPLLVASVLVPVILAWIGTGYVPPVYQASAQVLLERDRVQLGKIADVLTAPTISDAATVSNEIAILVSTPVLEAAAQRLGLIDADGRALAPDRTAELADATFLRRGLIAARRWFAGIGANGLIPDGRPAGNAEDRATSQIVETLRAALHVTRSLNSFVIDVVATAPDADEAAALANAVADAYLVAQTRAKRAAADQALVWMRGEIGALRARIGAQNRRIQEQRRELLAAALGDPVTTESQLRAVSNALAIARTEQADAESRLSRLRSVLDGGAVAEAGEVLDTPELASVRRQLADLRQQLAAELASRGTRRPAAAALRAQIVSLDGDARRLARQALDRLDLDLRIRTDRIAALERESHGLQQVALALEPAQVAITDLEREAAASQELYVVLLTRQNEIIAQKEAIDPDARILNAAIPPEAPTGPRRTLYAALAGVAGLFGFAGLALAMDAVSSRFESLGALETATGLTVLAAVRRRPKAARLTDTALGVLPAEDGIDLALALRAAGDPSPLVALVPAEAGTSASTLAIRLGAHTARRGRRTSIVEALPDPSGAPPSGTIRLAVQAVTEEAGADGARRTIAAASVGSSLALLVTPAIETSALAIAWARLADVCLVVVDGPQPERDPVLCLVARLREAGVAPAGVVCVAG